jgi:cation diffusion facilitator family transporter
MEATQTSRRTLLTPKTVGWGSVIVNVVLSTAKIVAGLVCRSQAILADGLHSGSDLVTDAAVLAGLRVSDRPADQCHPYGHRRVSTLVALFVGAALVGAAGWIAYDAIEALHGLLHRHTTHAVRAGLPFWLALATVPIKELAFQLTRHVGRKTSDVSLIANAWHHRTDAMAGLAAAAGLAGILLGGEDWRYLDPVTAIVLSAFLLVVAARIVRTSASELVDRAPDEKVLACIQEAVNGTAGVLSYHGFRARQIGGKVAMDIHVQVRPDLTVRQGHDIARAVRQRVFQAGCDVIEVIVHIEPAEAAPPPP